MQLLIKKFSNNKNGGAAIEFAFIAPIFILMFLGCFIAFDSLRAKRTIANSTIVISDLSTRLVEMNDLRIDEIYNAADALLGIYSNAADLNYTVTSIVNPLGVDDDLAVVWSHSTDQNNEHTTADLVNFDLPEIGDGQTLILVSTEGTYTPRFAPTFIKPTGLGVAFNTSEISVRRPRLVREICFRESVSNVTCSSNSSP